MSLSGEICETCGRATMGAGLRARSKDLGNPPDPTGSSAASRRATFVVISQKSAEAIVGAGRTAPKGRTSSNKEES